MNKRMKLKKEKRMKTEDSENEKGKKDEKNTRAIPRPCSLHFSAVAAGLSQAAVMPPWARRYDTSGLMTCDRQREVPMASRAFTSWHQLSTQKPPSQPLLTPTCGSFCCHSKAGNSFFTAENERALPVAATSSSPCRKRPFLLGSLVKLLNKS